MSKRIHFMGILGSGCSAAAIIAKSQGYEVDGCDLSTYSEYEDEVTKSNIQVAKNHDPSHVDTVDMLVVSPAITHYDAKNLELEKAKEKGIPLCTWQSFSGDSLQKDKFVIAISGTHGKSTTTAMTAHILEEAGLDPTCQLGAVVPKWQANYRIGQSKYYIIEADEYGNNFLNYHPDILVITNIEYDHPEYFQSEEVFISAFKSFCGNLKPGGKIFLGMDVATIISGLDQEPVDFARQFELGVPGEFNQENARLAFAASQSVGVDPKTALDALRTYKGLFRRLSLYAETNGVKIYDDYGHHPTAIRKTAKAVREQFPGNQIWLVFQPHMFTRTKILRESFVEAFKEVPVDGVILCDIFPSREHDTGEISSRDIVNDVAKASMQYGGSLSEVEKILLEKVKYGDIVVNMGAGDITTLSEKLADDLARR